VQLLEDCACQVLVYGECGMMEGDSPWDEPLSRKTNLQSIDLATYAEKLAEFSLKLNHRGIKLAYHYHLKMVVQTAEEIAAFCQATRPEVGLLLDTGHAYAAGADYGEILRRFGDRVVHIHLKDVRRDVLGWAHKNDVSFNSAVREGLFTVPGDGSVDFSEIAKFVKTSGYHGWVVIEAEQDPAKAAPRLYTEKAYQYVRNLLL
jgi:inosose dehydratase